ncbi:hypothetical protein Bca52824_013549 [Brassica carinata]|uniref:Uncharacterized protein n=1 Tax=Brassica carinata TaxID=52824 RepID=A0A8X7VZJ7_BRACI|nr:hypothetical protein Bca52824_013549 [Brassica carinata]
MLLLGARVAAFCRSGGEEAWVSTVARNLTLFGSEANLIICEQARRLVSHGYTLTFTKHLKFGLPSTLIVSAIKFRAKFSYDQGRMEVTTSRITCLHLKFTFS